MGRPAVKARTPTSAPGSSVPLRWRQRCAAGFTLIELMIVVALIAVAAGVVSLALRDPASTRLEHEAVRLAAVLESARAESRASGVAVYWMPQPLASRDKELAAIAAHYRFVGLPDSSTLPLRWLGDGVSAEIAGAAQVRLGPEPLIGAQRIVLRLADQRVDVATDGLGPFAIVTREPNANP